MSNDAKSVLPGGKGESNEPQQEKKTVWWTEEVYHDLTFGLFERRKRLASRYDEEASVKTSRSFETDASTVTMPTLLLSDSKVEVKTEESATSEENSSYSPQFAQSYESSSDDSSSSASSSYYSKH